MRDQLRGPQGQVSESAGNRPAEAVVRCSTAIPDRPTNCTTLSREAVQVMNDQESQGPLKLGLVATDPLRILGLQIIFSEDGIKSGPVEIVQLSVPGALDASGVSLILIDAACTDHIFELLATFRRTRPHLRLIVIGLEEDHEHIERVIGAGARGYLAHTARPSEVRLAIEIVHDGSAWAPRKV